MFGLKRSILSFFVILAIGFTVLFARLMVPLPWVERFWILMAGIWVSELLLGVTIIGIANNSGRALSFHLGNVTVAALHLGFSFLLLTFPFGHIGALLWVSGTLLLALFLHTLIIFAQHDVGGDAAAVKQAFALRNELQSELTVFEVAKRDVISGDIELAKAFGKLKDAARFASDGVPGCEAVDAEVRAALAVLLQSSDAAGMTRAVSELTARIGVRQDALKNLR